MFAKTAGLVILLVTLGLAAWVYLPSAGNLLSRGTTTTPTTSTTSQSYPASVTGSFTAYPTSTVRIDSVKASVSAGQNGIRTIQLEVGFTNIGNGTIYTIRGCGSSLNSAVTSGSAIVQAVTGGVRCLCAEGPSPVYVNQSQTALDPGCWSGYYYTLRQPGTFTVRLTLGWTGTSQFNSASGHVTILANFTVS